MQGKRGTVYLERRYGWDKSVTASHVSSFHRWASLAANPGYPTRLVVHLARADGQVDAGMVGQSSSSTNEDSSSESIPHQTEELRSLARASNMTTKPSSHSDTQRWPMSSPLPVVLARLWMPPPQISRMLSYGAATAQTARSQLSRIYKTPASSCVHVNGFSFVLFACLLSKSKDSLLVNSNYFFFFYSFFSQFFSHRSHEDNLFLQCLVTVDALARPRPAPLARPRPALLARARARPATAAQAVSRQSHVICVEWLKRLMTPGRQMHLLRGGCEEMIWTVLCRLV